MGPKPTCGLGVYLSVFLLGITHLPHLRITFQPVSAAILCIVKLSCDLEGSRAFFAEQAPVSAYDGSLDNLKDLKCSVFRVQGSGVRIQSVFRSFRFFKLPP